MLLEFDENNIHLSNNNTKISVKFGGIKLIQLQKKLTS
jgi:hypothetical protein